jgi:hypothetical protein
VKGADFGGAGRLFMGRSGRFPAGKAAPIRLDDALTTNPIFSAIALNPP